tara:strand:- start:643 stop:873 length:231 start_codon:yes stop_codon:yes gene_type:complete
MNYLLPPRFVEADELFYKHLVDEKDIFIEVMDLKEKCEYKSEVYDLLNEVVDMNIEIGQLHNKTTATLRKVRQLLK